MKDFRGMKRQRSRNRKPSGNQNNPNRAYESNGPEGTKARGNAQTIYEKYQQLARDANSSGDRVLAENHLQHAEHYFRMIRQMQPTRPVSEFVQRDPFSSGFDLDYDDEMDGEGNDGESETGGAGEDNQPGFDEPRYDNRDRNINRQNGERDNRNNNRQNNDRQNNDRQNNDRMNGGQPRSFEPRNGNNNNNSNNRPSGDRIPGDRVPTDRVNGEAAERVEYDADGNRRETRRERYERRRQQRLSEQEQNVAIAPAAPGFIASTEPLGAPNGRSMPAELVAEAPSQVREKRNDRIRAGGSDSDHLPAFIRTPAPVAPAAEAETTDAKPKRARKRKSDEVGASEEA